MNAATRAATRLALARGHHVLGYVPGRTTNINESLSLNEMRTLPAWPFTRYSIQNGFKGLLNGEVAPLSWADVDEWGGKGGSRIGTLRQTVTN